MSFLDKENHIDFEPMVEKWVEESCRVEAKEIIIKIIKWNDLFWYGKLLELYGKHIRGDGSGFCLFLDWLKWQLIKEGEMSEGGCFGVTPE
jgi:hypothetical protein